MPSLSDMCSDSKSKIKKKNIIRWRLQLVEYRTNQNTGISQTKQTKVWVLARRNRPKFWSRPDRTDRNMGFSQTEHTELWVLARPSRPKYGYWPDRRDRNMGIGQTDQTAIGVLARPNRPKYGHWPDRTDRNMGIGQTEQTELWAFNRPNRPKMPLARRKARPKFFPDHWAGSQPDPLSATHVCLANTCLGLRTSSWVRNLLRLTWITMGIKLILTLDLKAHIQFF